MIFAELVPKNLAIAKPMETARATQRFQRLFTAVMRGPIRVLNGSANAIVRRLGMEPQEELRSARSSTELASLISRSADEGTLDADTAELMERSVEFGTRTAGEIMTPRVRTISLEANDRAWAVIELARQTGPLPLPGARPRRRRDRHRARQARRGAADPRAPDHQGQAPDDPADRGARLAAARPPARPAAAGGPARRRARRVRRPGRHRDHRGRDRGDRRRHRRRARPARRAGTPAPGRLVGAVRACSGPTRSRTSPGSSSPTTRTTTPSRGSCSRCSAACPQRGDVAEVPVPDRSDPDQPERQQLAVLTVEHMDGLRIDRLTLRAARRGTTSETPGRG